MGLPASLCTSIVGGLFLFLQKSYTKYRIFKYQFSIRLSDGQVSKQCPMRQFFNVSSFDITEIH